MPLSLPHSPPPSLFPGKQDPDQPELRNAGHFFYQGNAEAEEAIKEVRRGKPKTEASAAALVAEFETMQSEGTFGCAHTR